MAPLRLGLVLVSMCAVACAVTHNLSRREAIRPSPVKGILILGVNPKTQVQINVGTRVSGVTWRRDASPPEADLAPEDGYIVIDLDATDEFTEYGITLISPTDSDYSYWACPRKRTVTFELPPNKASYVGDIDLELQHNAIGVKLSFDADRAKKFVEQRYPALVPDFRVTPAREKRVEFPGAPEQYAGMKCFRTR
jgi:hypothetical protein